jgi:uncharacterized membrane protein YhfC
MSSLYLLQGIGMITVALFGVIFWKKRSQVQFKFFLWGGLSWFVATILKTVVSIPTAQIITGLRDISPKYISEPLLWLYIGLLTGVFECGVSYVFIYRIQRLRIASWSESIGYGLGFGATEALLLGIYTFVIVLLIIFIPDQLPPEILILADPSKASLLAIPVPIVERSIVILLHTFSSVLIIFAVQNKEPRLFWFSFLYKTVMDAVAGYFQITYGLQNLTVKGVWLVELILLPFGLIGIWGLFYFRERFSNQHSHL